MAETGTYWKLVEKIRNSDLNKIMDFASDLKETDDIEFLILTAISKPSCLVEYEFLLEHLVKFNFNPLTNDGLIFQSMHTWTKENTLNEHQLNKILQIFFKSKSVSENLQQIIFYVKTELNPLLQFFMKTTGRYIYKFLLQGWDPLTKNSILQQDEELTKLFSIWLNKRENMTMVCNHLDNLWENNPLMWINFIDDFKGKDQNLKFFSKVNPMVNNLVRSSDEIPLNKNKFSQFLSQMVEEQRSIIKDSWLLDKNTKNIQKKSFTYLGEKKILALYAIENNDSSLFRWSCGVYDREDGDWTRHLCYAIQHNKIIFSEMLVASHCKLIPDDGYDPLDFALMQPNKNHLRLLVTNGLLHIENFDLSIIPISIMENPYCILVTKQLTTVNVCDESYIKINENFLDLCKNDHDCTELPPRVNVNYQNGKPLLTAVNANNYSMVLLLLKFGAYPSDQIILAAVINKNINLVLLFLKSNTNCGPSRFQQFDKALEIATTAGDKPMIELLTTLSKTHQASIAINSLEILREMVVKAANKSDLEFHVGVVGPHNPEVLDLAIKYNNIELLDILISKGVCMDFDSPNSPLILAAKNSNIDFYLKLEQQTKSLKENKWLPLYESVKHNNIQVFQHIITSRANLDSDAMLNAYLLTTNPTIAEILAKILYSNDKNNRDFMQSILEHALESGWNDITNFVMDILG
jgi:hypothetical protein